MLLFTWHRYILGRYDTTPQHAIWLETEVLCHHHLTSGGYGVLATTVGGIQGVDVCTVGKSLYILSTYTILAMQ